MILLPLNYIIQNIHIFILFVYSIYKIYQSRVSIRLIKCKINFIIFIRKVKLKR